MSHSPFVLPNEALCRYICIVAHHKHSEFLEHRFDDLKSVVISHRIMSVHKMVLNITEEHASQRLSSLDLHFQYITFCKDAIGVVRISFCRTGSAVFITMKMSLDAIKPPLSLRRVRRAAELSLRSHCEALVATADRPMVHFKLGISILQINPAM